ncbi:HAD-IIA family hydrolase [Halococcus saccharolyticus]|uniref:Arabinose operon protein AraL n=1 Tax=Halococcus saccharolyticus DSM 5350 TaxID=1227455 RepID=M0MDI7_9EURY|nr:HAD-IIA family hydrolase [Halococcus saccharolyticus]EMA43827.1 arabinose operon protein AraL [Halococcus saccharolyticus DSM 5350]
MATRGVIIDLDGTVYRGNTRLAGAREGIATLHDSSCDVCFVSNNPAKSPTEFAARLTEMDVPADAEAVVSAASVTATTLERTHSDADLFVIGSPGLRSILENRDFALTDDPAACDVLVASYDRGFEYDDMTDGLRAIEAGAAFVGTDPDRTIPTADGRAVPGSGAIINAITGVVDREPDWIAGKPAERMAETALTRLDCAPEECLVIGDRLDTDIAMGERHGMTTVLVLTGVTDRATLATSDIEPDHVIDGLGDIGVVLDTIDAD